jgi:HD-GYP domain-containing protein (c-di-GMP phosphodiesterase class II)
MSDTRTLQGKIAALRQRLEQVPTLTGLVRAPAKRPAADGADGLAEQIADGERRQQLLDAALRQLAAAADDDGPQPSQLTARARHLLERGRQLVGQLRQLAEDPLLTAALAQGEAENDPLAAGVRETVAMTESALRLVQAYPDAPSVQLRLSEGLEGILAVIADRVAVMHAALARRRLETGRAGELAELLTVLAEGHAADPGAFEGLASAVAAEAEQGEPLRFPHAVAATPALAVAWHSLTAAHVLARLARHDPDLRRQPVPLILAALIHDVGLLAAAPEVLTQAEPLTDEQRRRLESHPRAGADLLLQHLPAAGELIDAVLSHHERLDGTGYPAGLRDEQLGLLPRLLAVADTYAALCSPRPNRPALDPRTALTDTLLLAEAGGLDRYHAERLLLLSFYPVGSVVELADGSVGLVVATHLGRRDLTTPSRPVLALLTDDRGQLLPAPRHVDLAACDGRSIVRTLPPGQRRQVLGRRYPELVL